ncbi:zinc finger BED domain-containing protein RICESLEEPER 2-like protein [Tanacetum coccineum]
MSSNTSIFHTLRQESVKRSRSDKSKVWMDMIKIDNDTRAQCIHCKECYVIPDTGTTTTLAGHLKNCHQKKDADRKQQLLNFQRVSDEDTSSSFHVLATEWEIEDKIMTISVDNASANDAAMRILTAHFKRLGTLFCDGIFFHVRCPAHILNLMVQDGLEVIKDIVQKVHASVSYINASDSRLKVFSQVAQQLHLPERKLILDCKTRWNSTYKMLSTAILIKEAFSMYEVRDLLYKYCPSDDDWEKIERICETLQAFDSCTNIIRKRLSNIESIFWRGLVHQAGVR